MEPLTRIAASPLIALWVMTLLHSLWQGALLAGLLWLTLRGVRTASQRYWWSLASLLLLVLSLFVTYGVLERPSASISLPPTISIPLQPTLESTTPVIHSTNDSQVATNSRAAKRPTLSLHWQPILFMLWCIGVTAMLIRMGLLLGGTLRLRNQATVCNDQKLLERANQLQTQLGITRRIVLRLSQQVLIPCTVGILRPMILLPTTIIGTDTDEAEAILLHELAHIRRCDWLINIVQMAIESLLFFNPAVWWISRQIRIEREASCDQVAAGQSPHPIRYAECLLRFASIQCHQGNEAALALSSDKRRPTTERIQRLLIPGYRPTVLPGIIPVLLTLIALAFCGIGTVKTTRATIHYFGQHMTPQERAETIATLTKDYRPDNSQLADLPEDQWIQIKGKIVTEDGSPLPRRYHNGRKTAYVDAKLMTRTKNCSSSYPINADGTFALAVRQNHFTLSITCSDYATKHIIKEVEPGTKIEDWIITLEKGYMAFIKCVNPQGHPIQDACITGGYPSPPDYSSCTIRLNLISDTNGLVTFNNASETLMSLTCQAPGYIKSEIRQFSLNENEVKPWILQPSIPSQIHVVDKQTGSPLIGAQVYVLGPGFGKSFSDREGETQTDARGLAKLDSLLPGETYLVMVRPVNKQRQYVILTPGQSLQVECGPLRPIRGRIIGDLSCLPHKDDQYYIYWENYYHFNDGGYNEAAIRCNINIVNTREATFVIDDYYGQEIKLVAGPQHLNIDVEGGDDINNIRINLSPAITDSRTLRQVTFNFLGLDKSSLLEGQTFLLSYMEKDNTYTTFHDMTSFHQIGIKESQATVQLTIPNMLSWKPQAQTPFFFKEGYQRLEEDHDYTFDIECLPAGTIFGTINVPPEACYQHAYACLKFLNENDLFKQTGFLPNNDLNMTTQPQTKFMFSPIPLKGHYSFSFYSDNMFIVSDEIKFQPNRPLCEITLPWPKKPITLRGQILDHTGQPARGVDCSLQAKSDDHSHEFSDMKTDAGGWFSYSNVNPDKRLSYSISLKHKTGLRMNFPLKANENPITLKLEKGIKLSGTLKDHSGQLRPNEEIWLSPHQNQNNYYRQKFTTNSDGQFEVILGDIEYSYQSSRRLSENSWTSETVIINPSQDANIVLISDPRH